MAIINRATKELQLKIVYYGPAKSGKTTNLEQVHANVQVPDASAKGFSSVPHAAVSAVTDVDGDDGAAISETALPGDFHFLCKVLLHLLCAENRCKYSIRVGR